MALRVFLRGEAAGLRARLAADPNVEIVDVIDEAEAVLSLPPSSARAGYGLEPDEAADHERPVETLVVTDRPDSIHRLPHHLAASEGVNVKHPNSESCGLDGCTCDSIRNIVELQIKKYPNAGLREFPYKPWPRRSKKLRAYLKSADNVP